METKTLRFVPNYDPTQEKVGDPAVTLQVGIRGYKQVSNFFFSQIYESGKITTFRYGKSVRDVISSLLRGCCVNSEGIYLCSSSIKEYYEHKEDGHISLSVGGYTDRRKDYIVKRDIIRLDPINLFDLQCKHMLRYDVITDENGIIHNINYRLVDTKPLYTKGDDKESVKKLFNGVESINQAVSKYKKNNPDRLYGDDAVDEKYRLSMKDRIKKKKKELEDEIKTYDERFGSIEKLLNRSKTIKQILNQ